jgi:transcriptional regulator with XRE-family HTH domain
MATIKRSKVERERDLLELSDLYLKGHTQADIALRMGVSQQQISYDLKALQKRWRESALVNVDEAKARELAKVDQLEREYWDAWERSKGNAEIETIEQIGVRGKAPRQGDGEEDGELTIVPLRVKKNKRTEGRSGNPAFLAGIQWCINKRCEIMGLNAPIKQDVRLFDLDAWMKTAEANAAQMEDALEE